MIFFTFEPRDLWIGVYWTIKRQRAWIKWVYGIPVPCKLDVFELYVCVVPMFPLVLYVPLWSTKQPKELRCS